MMKLRAGDIDSFCSKLSKSDLKGLGRDHVRISVMISAKYVKFELTSNAPGRAPFLRA